MQMAWKLCSAYIFLWCVMGFWRQGYWMLVFVKREARTAVGKEMRNNNRKWSDRGLRQWEAKSRRVEARLWLSPCGEHLLDVGEDFPLGSRIPPCPLHLNCPGKKGKLHFGAVSPRNWEPNCTPSLIHHSRESLALMHWAVSSVCRFSMCQSACACLQSVLVCALPLLLVAPELWGWAEFGPSPSQRLTPVFTHPLLGEGKKNPKVKI